MAEVALSRLIESEKNMAPKELRDIYMEVAKKVPRRTIVSVYDHIRTRFHRDVTRDYWSQKEQKQLIE
jgi:hypothetical protein